MSENVYQGLLAYICICFGSFGFFGRELGERGLGSPFYILILSIRNKSALVIDGDKMYTKLKNNLFCLSEAFGFYCKFAAP